MPHSATIPQTAPALGIFIPPNLLAMPITPAQKIVMAYLTGYLGTNGEFPRRDDIAHACGLGVRTVGVAINDFVRRGWLAVVTPRSYETYKLRTRIEDLT